MFFRVKCCFKKKSSMDPVLMQFVCHLFFVCLFWGKEKAQTFRKKNIFQVLCHWNGTSVFMKNCYKKKKMQLSPLSDPKINTWNKWQIYFKNKIMWHSYHSAGCHSLDGIEHSYYVHFYFACFDTEILCKWIQWK